ncbi:hypothetical protein HAX54_007689 [Datura stramonium]|uniref:Uncharacterized protein n=1 Tax=Datura stramonium TaxID=4076 RepID=A0ABS8WWX0_DATST|nr:hypothetical protein [Datura stramonium]
MPGGGFGTLFPRIETELKQPISVLLLNVGLIFVSRQWGRKLLVSSSPHLIRTLPLAGSQWEGSLFGTYENGSIEVSKAKREIWRQEKSWLRHGMIAGGRLSPAARFPLPNTKERLREEQYVGLKKRVPSSLHSPTDPHLLVPKAYPSTLQEVLKEEVEKEKKVTFPANLLALFLYWDRAAPFSILIDSTSLA